MHKIQADEFLDSLVGGVIERMDIDQNDAYMTLEDGRVVMFMATNSGMALAQAQARPQNLQ
jgi:hypothetical protein